jgi:hypothetical protein
MAELLGVPLHKVQHVLATRPHIQPSARAGTLRLYDREAVGEVRAELLKAAGRRGRRHA